MEAQPNSIPADPSGASGGTAESSELTQQVYDQLRVIARARLAGQPAGHTLQATALVNEAYLKLQNHPSILAADRASFFRAAANAMRQILVDHARSRGRLKRGGPAKRDFVDVAGLAEGQDPGEILALDEAIRRLEDEEPQAARVMKLRFFTGLSVEETARVLGLSERTVKREWQFARAWLYRALE